MYLVEAYFRDQATAEKLKSVVRKPVMHGGYVADVGCVGWEYKNRRSAVAAFKRLCRVTDEFVYVADYDAEPDSNTVASRAAKPH